MGDMDEKTGDAIHGSYAFPLGDELRGERATLGKSLLDVQRDLRIKAAYIAAIEDARPDVFPNPAFIPGYVRSYARYLGMDPEATFETFCRESNFATAHGMSKGASTHAKPCSIAIPANLRVASGSIEDMSMTKVPGAAPSLMPSFPKAARPTG